jgi:hypothetical protein
VGPRAGLDRCGKSRPHGIRSPDRPARSQSLHRLRYPGPIYQVIFYKLIQHFLSHCFNKHESPKITGLYSGIPNKQKLSYENYVYNILAIYTTVLPYIDITNRYRAT